MGIYEELIERGLLAQVTDEQEIRKMVNAGKATFYIGFDCTADSLTAGHFMALTLMKRLQMAGNKPIALIGGGTTMIGDPSGRTDMRKMLTREDIDHNAACFKRQMERFINKAHLIHGDLSSYNILNFDEEPVIIDVSQSVVRDHIIANELLERDIKNISFEFSKMGVDTSIEDLTNRLIKD